MVGCTKSPHTPIWNPTLLSCTRPRLSTHANLNPLGPIINPSTNFYDTRDLAAFPNYEACNQRTLEEYTRPLSTPAVDPWYDWQLRILQISEILAGRQPDSDPSVADDVFYWLKGEDYINQVSYESDLGILASSLLPLYSYTSMAIQEKQKKDPRKFALSEIAVKNVKTLVETAQKYLSLIVDHAKLLAEDPWPSVFSLTEDLRVPHWDFFHLCYSKLDMSRLIADTIKYMAKINVSTKQLDQKWIDGLAQWCGTQRKEIQRNLQKAAQSLQYRLRLTNMVEEMKRICYEGDETMGDRDPVGTELQEMSDDSWVRDTSRILLSSWEEALDGILGMKAEC